MNSLTCKLIIFENNEAIWNVNNAKGQIMSYIILTLGIGLSVPTRETFYNIHLKIYLVTCCGMGSVERTRMGIPHQTNLL